VFFRERVPFTKKITPLCVSVSTGGGGSGQHISQHFFSGVLPAWYQDFSGAGGQIHVHIRLFVVQNRASQRAFLYYTWGGSRLKTRSEISNKSLFWLIFVFPK
jgi:hypothetical protein